MCQFVSAGEVSWKNYNDSNKKSRFIPKNIRGKSRDEMIARSFSRGVRSSETMEHDHDVGYIGDPEGKVLNLAGERGLQLRLLSGLLSFVVWQCGRYLLTPCVAWRNILFHQTFTLPSTFTLIILTRRTRTRLTGFPTEPGFHLTMRLLKS